MNISFKNDEKLFVERDNNILLKSEYLKNVYEEFSEEDILLRDIPKEDFLEIIKLLEKTEQIDYQEIKLKKLTEEYVIKDIPLDKLFDLIKICDFLDISDLFQKISLTIAYNLKGNHKLLNNLNDNIITNIIEYLENDEIDNLSEEYKLDPFYYKNIKINYFYKKKYMNITVSYENFYLIKNDVIYLNLKNTNKIPEQLISFDNLRGLDLHDRSDISKLENLPQNLHTLYLYGNDISKIENLPPNLHTLYSKHNPRISKIENLPPNLRRLFLNNFMQCQISKIENLPESLYGLYLSGTHITKIENLPSKLRILYLMGSWITKIENLPENLHALSLSGNKITKIENLPESLYELYLMKNQITKIENLPENLHTLNLSWNKITKIENLPENLHALSLSENQITKIENLPSELRILYLMGNQIEKIENLPENLEVLYISKYQFDRIENLPENLLKIYIRKDTDNPFYNLYAQSRFYFMKNKPKNCSLYFFYKY